MRKAWVGIIGVLAACSGNGEPNLSPSLDMGAEGDAGAQVDTSTTDVEGDWAITMAPAEIDITNTAGMVTVSLSHAPDAGPVTVQLSTSADLFEIEPASIVFTDAGELEQTATVRVGGELPCAARTDTEVGAVVMHDGGYADAVVEPLAVFTTARASALEFDVVPLSVVVNEEDQTTADVVVTLTDGCLLDDEQIEIPVEISDEQIAVDTSVLTFDSVGQERVVTVSPVDDCESEGPSTSSVMLGPIVSGPHAGAELPNVEVANIDNGDDYKVNVNPALLVTRETGTTATFNVTVGFCPLEDVEMTVTATVGDITEGNIMPASVMLDRLEPTGTFTVTGLDDATCDGNQTYQVTFNVASDDPDYDGLALPAVAITNQDDDAAVLASTSALAIVEGDSDVFNLYTSCATVNATINNLSPTQMTVSPVTTTLTTTPQPITLSTVDDSLTNGDRAVYLEVLGAQPLMIPVTILDDD